MTRCDFSISQPNRAWNFCSWFTIAILFVFRWSVSAIAVASMRANP
jgi:hypothetical protein